MTMNASGIQQTENEAAAPGQLDDDEELTKEITDNLRDGRKHWASWRKRAKEDYDFFASKQWSDEDKEILDEQRRPAVTFNRIARTVNAVAGLELQNRQEVRYLPRQLGNTGFNEMLTNAAKWVRDSCDAEDEESEAFQDSIICGCGWTETTMDYETEAEGKILIDRIDPLQCIVDPDSEKRNFADARWVARIKEVTRKELMEMFPDADIEPATFWNDSDSNQPHNATDAHLYIHDQSGRSTNKTNTYDLVDYQYWKRETFYKVIDLDGSMLELTSEKFNKLQKIIKEKQMQYAKITKRVYKKCFLVGNKILEQIDLGCDHFTLRGITGLRDRNEGQWFGLVALMKDPQRWANKWLSQIQHIVNSGAKSGIIAEQDAISNPGKFEDNYAKPGTVSYVNPGAISQNKIMPKPTPAYPDGVDRLLQYAIQSINDVPGVNLEMMGMADRDQAIGLEETRKQAGITMLANFFDALRRYRKEQGRVLAYFIREYIADGRLIRVVGQEGAQYIPLLKDKLTFEYDVVVEDAPNSPNMKERVFTTLNQIIPMALQAGIPIPPEVLDYAPLPEMLAQKWKQMVNRPPDPMAEQMKQIQMQMAQIETKLKESEVYLNYAKAEQAHSTGQNEAALASTKMAEISGQHALDTHAMQLDAQRKEAEAAHSMQIKNIQVTSDMQRKNAEMLMNQNRKMQEANMNAKIKAQSQQNRANV
jgi:uncharacterized protein YfeS